MNFRRVAAPIAASLAACLLVGGAQAPPAPSAPRAPPPGEGVICAWAIYTAMANVGDKCFPGRNPALQAKLRAAEARIDAYVRRNDKTATPESMADFKRRQGQLDLPPEQLCRGDAVELYRRIEQGAGTAEMWTELDRVLARDGPPTWGTCF